MFTEELLIHYIKVVKQKKVDYCNKRSTCPQITRAQALSGNTTTGYTSLLAFYFQVWLRKHQTLPALGRLANLFSHKDMHSASCG